MRGSRCAPRHSLPDVVASVQCCKSSSRLLVVVRSVQDAIDAYAQLLKPSFASVLCFETIKSHQTVFRRSFSPRGRGRRAQVPVGEFSLEREPCAAFTSPQSAKLNQIPTPTLSVVKHRHKIFPLSSPTASIDNTIAIMGYSDVDQKCINTIRVLAVCIHPADCPTMTFLSLGHPETLPLHEPTANGSFCTGRCDIRSKQWPPWW